MDKPARPACRQISVYVPDWPQHPDPVLGFSTVWEFPNQTPPPGWYGTYHNWRTGVIAFYCHAVPKPRAVGRPKETQDAALNGTSRRRQRGDEFTLYVEDSEWWIDG